MRGKAWTVEEEKQLKQMLQEGRSVRVIARVLGKTRDCVRMKIARLGLNVVVHPKSQPRTTTTKLTLPEDLPSVEDQLRVLAAALEALKDPDLEQKDVLRLRTVIQGVKTYRDLFVDYVNYRALEQKVEDLIHELERDREKSSGLARK